ncbi:hypothetical protein IFM89_021080 [Coptis chinensis]|uniref:Peptidase M48 domain-containing protein n=1 Tax=Coptis chinensis TaxID=261450 RepID=A0A835LUY8_9MAGN|nr:hypothetical protein IFM89_021080 [Coptis chinensis]
MSSPMLMEKAIGYVILKQRMSRYTGKVLDEKHPQSVRARLILRNILKGLVKRNPNYASGFRHFDDWIWEIAVIDDPTIFAYDILQGKIFISNGLLEYFRNDTEVATIIRHEVGHFVARHHAECPTLPLSHRHMTELEADYIGLLLMASAGYDPRIAPKMWKKMEIWDSCDLPEMWDSFDLSEGLENEEEDEDSLSTHPSDEERANFLAQNHIMEEALTIYYEVQAQFY